MVYIFLADGFEEIEALAPVDVLRRAGVQVTMAGVNGKTITGGHDIKVLADISAEEINRDDIEAIILPGGLGGTNNMEASSEVQGIIDYCVQHGLLIAAICAAPSILAHKGLLKGVNATAYPSFSDDLKANGAIYSEEYVCRDGNIITAKGMGVSLDFGFELIKALKGEEAAAEVRASIQFPV